MADLEKDEAAKWSSELSSWAEQLKQSQGGGGTGVEEDGGEDDCLPPVRKPATISGKVCVCVCLQSTQVVIGNFSSGRSVGISQGNPLIVTHYIIDIIILWEYIILHRPTCYAGGATP